ncbi:hypothetical protein [Myxococcus sp. Y35]|uniref:hypothetical protein n=1 Tax=Pseudomyxococcus flavus TaxID=3115648 RepID=UPI003CF884D9
MNSPKRQMGPYVPGHEPKKVAVQTPAPQQTAPQGQKPAQAAKEEEEPKGFKNHETYPKLLDTPLTVRQQFQDGKDRVQTWKDNRNAGHGIARTTWEGTKDNFKKSIADGKNPKDLDQAAGKLGKANTLLKFGVGGQGLVSEKAGSAWDAVVNGGLTSGSATERNEALKDVSDAGKTATETLKAGLETARDVQKYGSAYRAASKSLEADAPDLNGKGRRAIARDIAKKAFNNVDAGDVGTDAKFDALKKANRTSAKDIAAEAHDVSKNKAQELLNKGVKTGAEKTADNALDAAIEKGAKAAGGMLAKGAGRFVPGANVAIAGFDVAKAIATQKSNENVGKKATAWITAAGSIAAATNIPVVSQVGAAVSTVSDFVGSFF